MSQALPVLIFWCCSVTQTCQTLVTPCTARTQDSPAIQISQRFIQSHVLWVNDAFQPSHHLSFPSSPALYLSQHQFLPSDFPLGLKRLIYGSSCAASVLLRITWNHFLHTLLVWTPFSPCFLQPSCCKSSIFWQSVLVFLLTPPYITPENQLWPFRSFSISSQLCNMILRLAIAFHPMGKCLLVSWLQSHHTVISEIKKVKLVINSTASHQHISKWWGRIPWSYFLCLLACLFVFVLSFNPAFSISPFTFSS